MKIILASDSPRRKKLLGYLGIKFYVIPSDLNEAKVKESNPKALTQKLALAKALAVRRKVKTQDFLIIAADTVVVLGKKILGKPNNKAQAREILNLLKGKVHEVITGVVVLDNTGQTIIDHEASKVFFKNFKNQDLEKYLDKNLFKDKAGAYGIQDLDDNILEKYLGSYTNILGLPLKKTISILTKFGVKIKTDD